MGLTKLFFWLRKPIVEAVEPEEPKSIKSVIQSIREAKKAFKPSGTSVVQEAATAPADADRTADTGGEEKGPAPPAKIPPPSFRKKGRLAPLSRSPPGNPKASPTDDWQSGVDWNDVEAQKDEEQEGILPAVPARKASELPPVSPTRAGGPLVVDKALKAKVKKNQDKLEEETIEVPQPRHFKATTLPFCYSLICGFGGLFMIYVSTTTL